LQYDRDPVALADVPRGRVLAFCGIGNPEPFWESLRSLGFELVGTRAFADHQDYTRRDIDELTSWARSLRPDMVITTQKDAVKLPLATLADIPLLALKIEAEIMQGSEQLEEMLDRLVEPPPADRWESQSET
jgi:tetraacyldisaccharide 4'-kinase